jgi:DNA-binding transcriptional MerR regulator
VGVSGTTIGQWARRGLIRASRSAGDPHVYSVEDVAEAAIVAELLRRGVRHRQIHRALEHLPGHGAWPLSDVRLETTPGPRPRLVLREDGRAAVLGPRGWQVLAVAPEADEVRLRLRRSAHPGPG